MANQVAVTSRHLLAAFGLFYAIALLLLSDIPPDDRLVQADGAHVLITPQLLGQERSTFERVDVRSALLF